ncbi:MAG TPA: DUF4838 domain-containing protein, partial [bacterium]|nr:DUF4838 domain-containing protein [bacterium]
MDRSKKVFLVKNGQPVAAVYLPQGVGQETRQASQELVRVIYRSTGVKLPVTTEKSLSPGQTLIQFSIRRAGNRKFQLPPEDSFIISARTGEIKILISRPEVLPVAVARFLEETTGARWFFPGPAGEDIPLRKDVFFLAGRKSYQPAFAWRSLGWKDNSSVEVWQKKNGLLRFPINRGHAYSEILPRRLFRSHPEFFSLICGRRRINPSQMCFSAPGILEQTLNYVARVFQENPGLVAVSLCPADVDYFCECHRCRQGENPTRYYDLYVREPAYGYGGPGFAAHLSERVFRFTNRVADEVARKFPGRYLIVYAYGAYRYPPEGIRIRDNVIIWLTTTCLGWWNPERKKLEIQRIKAWRQAARNIVIFEALSNQAWPEVPRIAPRLVAESLRTYRRLGIRGFYSQMFGDFGTNLPNYYLAARYLRDTRLDYQKELASL